MNKTCQSGEFSSWSLSSGVVELLRSIVGRGPHGGMSGGQKMEKTAHKALLLDSSFCSLSTAVVELEGKPGGQKQPKPVAQRPDMVSDTLALLIY